LIIVDEKSKGQQLASRVNLIGKVKNWRLPINVFIGFLEGVEPEWLLEPPPTSAARDPSPGLAPGGTSAAVLLKKIKIRHQSA